MLNGSGSLCIQILAFMSKNSTMTMLKRVQFAVCRVCSKIASGAIQLHRLLRHHGGLYGSHTHGNSKKGKVGIHFFTHMDTQRIHTHGNGP